MKVYKVAVEWTMTKTLLIEADDLDDAIAQAEEDGEAKEGEYLDESFTVNNDLSEELNSRDDDEEEESEED